MDRSEAGGRDLILIQTFLLYYENQVILVLTSIFQGQYAICTKRSCDIVFMKMKVI